MRKPEWSTRIHVVIQRRARSADEPVAGFGRLNDLIIWLTRRKLLADAWPDSEHAVPGVEFPTFESLVIYRFSSDVNQGPPAMLGSADVFLEDLERTETTAQTEARIADARASINKGARAGLGEFFQPLGPRHARVEFRLR